MLTLTGIPLLVTGVTSAVGRGQLVAENPTKYELNYLFGGMNNARERERGREREGERERGRQ